MFLHILISNSQDGTGLSVDLTRSVADAVLGQQDEKGALAALEKIGRDDDKGIFAKASSLFGASRGKEGLWESACRRALSVSDLQFLSDLKNFPVDHDLYATAINIEETANFFFFFFFLDQFIFRDSTTVQDRTPQTTEVTCSKTISKSERAPNHAKPRKSTTI